MKISVIRTGGYAGLSDELVALDTADLDATAARRVEELVRGIRFFELPRDIAGGAIGADMFRYEIAVTDADRQHSIGFVADESPETAPLRRLVDALTQIA